MIQPDFDTFTRLALQGNLVPIYREILADLDTPLSAFIKISENQPYAFLLESVQGGEKWGRYSLLGADPAALFTIHGQRALWQRPGSLPEVLSETAPLETLRTLMHRYQPVAVPGLPRFHGGAVGYLGYDVVRLFEQIPDTNPHDLGTPDALFMFTDTLLIFDNLLGRIKVVANASTDSGRPLEEIYQEAVARVNRLVATLRRPTPPVPMADTTSDHSEEGFRSNMTRDEFEAAVARAKEYIVAGDIMQVVLSQRLSTPFAHDPLQLYRALRGTNPSPYLFLLRLGEFSLVGSSPEILVRQENDTATVRPIAGTRPRGATPEEDLELEKDLLADPKELAEHIMLVDLGRNDLGRVAVTGSVRVTERLVIERYSHVMHIVSNVEARLKPGLDAFDLMAATFPAGTVTGAPKIRAMQIIDELETVGRGPYAGCVGYLSYSGHMDLAITIRTALIKDGQLHIQAGAGIVADSSPAKEYEETLNKARAVLRAVAITDKGMD